MKKLLVISIGLVGLISCKKDDAPDATLSEKEKTDLIFLREEEKLARDVYDHCYEKYGLNVFNNISSSEETHFSNVLTLLQKYGIEDPAANKLPGEFSNAALQQLYDDLIQQADVSLMAALQVGATIEDMDISDIKLFYANTTLPDLISVYDALTCGSRNHLRSFMSQIKSAGGTYTPQYINQTEFDAIVNSEKEQCPAN